MTDTTRWANAVRRYSADVLAARDYVDPTGHPDEVARHRQRMLAAARDALRADTPAVPASVEPRRAAVLDALRPTTADAVAVQGREWSKVEALLGDDGGRVLPRIIDQSDATRLAAILDHIETWEPVLRSGEGDAILAELRGRIFDRLVALGDADAVLVAETAQANAPVAAWAQVMTEALDGDVSVDARTAVHRADLPGYDYALADLPLLADAVRHIDVRGERAGTAVLR